ncbi:VOC family protein [Pontibacter chinhatensis]|uniref:Lactoylglutathione lyase n=1 Tax=Pontibacter chinhatensis TaxID=1436961 RepID=A0A1I2UM41_9BACT|nr:VOC family protein [Pontibacter chinhatensis]SFG76717.1 lactoylglutathione lyase [Pontibacter chinhatensis]
MKQFVTACICCLLSLATFSVGAQTNPITLRLNHIAVYVHDLGQSTTFYEDVLQLKQIPEPFHDGLHTWFSLGDAGQLHLIQGAAQNIARDKNDHLCFSVDSIEDFIANLDKHQVAYTNWPGTAKAPTVRVDGVKQIYFQDPDGHWIEVNNDKPGK